MNCEISDRMIAQENVRIVLIYVNVKLSNNIWPWELWFTPLWLNKRNIWTCKAGNKHYNILHAWSLEKEDKLQHIIVVKGYIIILYSTHTKDTFFKKVFMFCYFFLRSPTSCNYEKIISLSKPYKDILIHSEVN